MAYDKIIPVRDYPKKQDDNKDGKVSDLQNWIHSDCIVKECIDGNIFVEESGYVRLYNCPRCIRSGITPGSRIFRGNVSFYTNEEMTARMESRRDLVFDRTGRYDRAKEIVRGLAEIFGGDDVKVRRAREKQVQQFQVDKEEDPF